MLALDAVETANSGHPGLPLGAAPMAYVLWTQFLKFNPGDPFWPDRDRFVLSAGHGSALLYAMLHLTGYDISIEDLRQFRQWGSKTPGHPEYLPACGIETTTGPLGQGFANGVGIAIAERHLAAMFNSDGQQIVDHYIYGIVSDGDLMEGIASEAASLAGDLRLGRLIYLYDNNHITLSADTKLAFRENVGDRFDAYGWQVLRVADANDTAAINGALTAALEASDQPSLIIVTSHIGYGSPKQDTFEVHGAPLGPEDTVATKDFYGWPAAPLFYVPEEVRNHMVQPGQEGARREAGWQSLMEAYAIDHPERKKKWDQMMGGRTRPAPGGEQAAPSEPPGAARARPPAPVLPEGWYKDVVPFKTGDSIATRAASGQVLNQIAPRLESLIGGSADLDPSTKTALKGKGNFQRPGTGKDTIQGAVSGPWGYEGGNIAYGVREHAMAGITSGLALHGGLLPFCATFFIFSDYMRPAIRLCAMMRLPVVYVFTHDSVGLGQDGPTHEPVEQLASLRAMPVITVIRPADASETAEAWRLALERSHGGSGPTALVLTRQGVPVIDRQRYGPADGLRRGGYILADSSAEEPELIIIATGSEVQLALGAYEKLAAEGTRVRVVSLPSWEVFEEQDATYRRHVLPDTVTRRLSVEAAASLGWRKYVGPEGDIMAIDRFGASAPGATIFEKLGFSISEVYERAKGLLHGHKTRTQGG